MRIPLIALILIQAAALHGAEIVWTNTSGGDWATAANWSPNKVPGSTDAALITNAGTYSVNITATVTVTNLQVGGASGTQTLTNSGGTLNAIMVASVGPNGQFVLGGGTLGGTNPVALAGAMVWTGGSMGGSAGVNVLAGGTLTVSGSGAKSFQGSLTNAGTMVYAPTGAGYLNCVGSSIHILAGGVCEMQTDNQLNDGGGVNRFVNEGTLRRTTSAGTFTNEIPFSSRGVVDAQTGAIRMTGGGTLATGSLFSGDGETLLANGTFTMAGAVVSTNLVVTGSATTLAGAGSVSGRTAWNQGTLTGDLLVAADGILTIDGSGTKSISGGSLTNAGTVIYAPASGGYVSFVNAEMHILPGGVCELQTDNRFRKGSNGNSMVNEGTLRQTTSVGMFTNDIPFINCGVVDVQSGTLLLAEGGTLGAGSAFTGAGQTVLAAGTFNLDGTIASDNLVLDGAVLGGTGGFNGSLTWIGGSISASVDLNIPAGGRLLLLGSNAKTVSGSITNAGTITYASSNYFSLVKTLHNQPGGLFEIWNDQQINRASGQAQIINEGIVRKLAGLGTTTNDMPTVNSGSIEVLSGTIRFLNGFTQTLAGNLTFQVGGTSVGSYGQMAFAQKPVFTGSLSVQWSPGYVPAAGDSFPMLTFPACETDFRCWDGLYLLGHGLRLEPEWSATALTLVTVAAPDPTNIPVRVTVEGEALVCWPSEFGNYQLYANTNLTTTNWTLLPGVTNRFVDRPLAPEKFFRVTKP